MESSTEPAGQKRAADSPASDMPSQKKMCSAKMEGLGFLEMLSTEMVEISIGKGNDKKHTRVHKGLLCSKIPYFEKMLSGGFKEAAENSAKFPEEDIEAFKNLMQWVYSGTLPRFRWVQDLEGEDGEFESSWCIGQTYLLLDKFCLFSLADQALTDFITATAEMSIVPDFGLIQSLYELAPQGSPLRKLALQYFHFAMNGQKPEEVVASNWDMAEVKDGFLKNGEFLFGYLKLMHQHNNQQMVQDPGQMPMCAFHHHAEGEPCSVNPAC
ncbi:hypothetical protein V8E51_015754 [Hyaloscypha variabilis]